MNIVMSIICWILLLLSENILLIAVIFNKKKFGTFQIDRKNFDQDVYKMEVKIHPDDIRQNGWYLLKVDVDCDLNDLSQKNHTL